MDGYVRAGVMVLTEQVKSISNSRNKDQKSTSCSSLLMWIKTRRHQFKSEKLRKERWPLLNTYYGQDILRAAMVWIWNIPPKAHVFEHLVQAKNAVWEGCRTFRKRRKKWVGTWGGPWGVMSWVHFLFILPLQHDQLASWPFRLALPTTMEGILPNCNPEETSLP